MESPENTVPELVKNSLQLVKSEEADFIVETIFWCEVLPIRNLEKKSRDQQKTKLFIGSMEQALVTHTYTEIIRLNRQIRALEDGRGICCHNIQFNYKYGLPTSRNCNHKNFMHFAPNIPYMDATTTLEKPRLYSNQCICAFQDTTSYRRPRNWQTNSRFHPQTLYYYMSCQF